MKLWAGRFSKEIDSLVNDFNSSVSFDKRLYKQDIKGSIAHAMMLQKCGIITKEEAEKIISGLNEILAELENGTLEFDIDAEDVHMNIELMLTKKIGDAGKKLHTARSRNDQVALDIRLYIKEECLNVKHLLLGLLEVISTQAQNNKDTIMPGYTHLQRAQPITFSHHMLAYAQMFMRDVKRIDDCFLRLDEMPLGSGALATSTYSIDRQFVADELGFDRITQNSLDSVSDRDFLIELASDISIIMMHLSRFSEEIILWCSSEFSFVELDDAYATGSSIMPQKKNPDIAELVRGKTGRVYGSLISLLTMLKGLPLAYNKDMQEDKEAIFDSIDTVKLCLKVFSNMLNTTKIKRDKMREAAAGGFTNATDCADYLTKKGMPFRDAYKIIGGLVQYCIQKQCPIERLSLDELKQFSPLFTDDVYSAISLETCVEQRKVPGGPAKSSVENQLEYLNNFINKHKEGGVKND